MAAELLQTIGSESGSTASAGRWQPLAVRESEPAYAAKPRLLDQVRAALRARHYSGRTEDSYIGWIRRYIVFHGKRHPAQMGAPEVTGFLTSLAVDGEVAASTQNQALSALLFLYRDVLAIDLPWLDDIVRAKRPLRLPVVLSRDEVRAMLQRLESVPRLMASLLYGAGLRVLECCRLRVQDIDFTANQIVIRGGKGDKDRVTMLPAVVKADLARHLTTVRTQHQHNLAVGAGWVALPTALQKKYPNAGREWVWQWVFPATRMYRDRLTGQLRRHHLHETVLQKADPAYASALVRHAPARRRPRHPHCAGAARPSGRRDHHDLHPRPQPGPSCRPEPGGQDIRPMIWPAAFAGDHNGIDGSLSQPIPIARWHAARTETREGTGETTNTKTH